MRSKVLMLGLLVASVPAFEAFANNPEDKPEYPGDDKDTKDTTDPGDVPTDLKPDDKDDFGLKDDEDRYKVPDMKTTKIPEYDTFFGSARPALENLKMVERNVDQGMAKINSSVGLSNDSSIDVAIAALKAKAGRTKITLDKSKMALRAEPTGIGDVPPRTEGDIATTKTGDVGKTERMGSIPRLVVPERASEDLRKTVMQFNEGLDELDKAYVQIHAIRTELDTFVTRGDEFNGRAPDAAKTAGLSTTDTTNATKYTMTNVDAIRTAKQDADRLHDEVGQVEKKLQTAFGGVS